MSYLYDEPERSGNIIVDHWKGLYSLPRAFWINNFLISNIIITAIFLGQLALSETNLSLQLISLAGISSIVLGLAVWTWSIVGVWKSADAHQRRGGSASWAGLAKLAVIFGLLGTAGQLSRQLPGIIETTELAIGGDSLGNSAELAVVGSTVTVVGTLASGVSLEFSELLEANGNVRKVVLSSAGGRSIEGTRIGQLIRERSLDTHVEGNCESACTLALLAGQRRTASFGSTVGFHQPSFPGTTAVEQAGLIEDLSQEYSRAGVSFSFIRRAMQASPDEMWYPDETALFEANVLNAMDSERVRADQLASAGEINRRAPVRVDDVTVLVGAKADNNVLRQEFDLSLMANQFDPSFFHRELAEQLREEVCSIALVPRLIEAGAIYEYAYRDVAGQEIAIIKIDHC
ncbi:hypothetical protein [Altererythrobacter sp. GH1-8]|uniref:COG3904 family protein n=1 Tax=Altererythrobacter sp. GH1-8 TaxID=3349333 RepID=UPI00374D1F45